jgi:hypothetical protein
MFDLGHAFCCFAILLNIADYCTIHKCLYYINLTLSMNLII